MTLKKQIMGEDESITKVIVKDVGGTEVCGAQLANWAIKMLAVMDSRVEDKREGNLLIGPAEAHRGKGNVSQAEEASTDGLGQNQVQFKEGCVGQSNEEDEVLVGQDQFTSSLGQDSQTFPRIVEVDVNILSEIVDESLVTSPTTPLSLSRDKTSMFGIQSKDSNKHREDSNMQRRYQTRGANRSWS